MLTGCDGRSVAHEPEDQKLALVREPREQLHHALRARHGAHHHVRAAQFLELFDRVFLRLVNVHVSTELQSQILLRAGRRHGDSSEPHGTGELDSKMAEAAGASGRLEQRGRHIVRRDLPQPLYGDGRAGRHLQIQKRLCRGNISKNLERMAVYALNTVTPAHIIGAVSAGSKSSEIAQMPSTPTTQY